uniref:Gametogenetin n=1 Tax=Pogona vitticeps TaxID=103695 RepID=A0ABM5EQW8_9SAUR
MGNVQSETSQESESAKDGEEKTNPDRSKPPDRGPKSSKHELESRGHGPPILEAQTASQPLNSEPGGGDRQVGTPEMGKNHSKKSKLKLSSMWAQNSASGGIKEASLCDKDPLMEKRGLACLSRADLQSRQVTFLQEDQPKELKVVLGPPQAAATDPRDLSVKRAPAKGKSRLDSAHLDQNMVGPQQQQQHLEKVVELGHVTGVPKEGMATEIVSTQHARTSAKESLEKEGHPSEALPSAKKQPLGASRGAEPSKMTEEAVAGPRTLNERSASGPAPSGCPALSGGKKTLLSWGAGQEEKEPAGQRDSTPGCDGDSQGLAFPPSSPPVEPPKPLTIPEGKPQAPESEGKAGAKDEAPGAEVVSSVTMQELMEKGLHFLYKVTIQPGQWPSSLKAGKQKPSVLTPGISYADILKQSPQKKPSAGAPVLPKALHHLASPSKKLPTFKGLEKDNPEDFSSLCQLFPEHFKEAAPKGPAPQAPSQQVVTFLEELSAGNPKGTEWQRPRPPTPYPQRRKGQGRKLPRFGTAVSQVVAFLGSNPKGDWLVQDEGQMPPNEATTAAVAKEEEGPSCPRSPGGAAKAAKEVGFFQPLSSLFSEGIPMEIDDPPLRPQRRPPGPDKGAKETIPVKVALCNASRAKVSPLVATHSFQKEEPIPPAPPLRPTQRSPRETQGVPSLASAAPPCAPAGLVPDPKAAPAATQARPKLVRKQGPGATKSKEKLKTSGPSKSKAPKGKGHKQWPRGYGMTPALRLEGPPLFPPFEKVARPFYFGEPLETPLALDKPATVDVGTSTQASPEEDGEAEGSDGRHWPAFQVSDSCPMRCYCKHQAPRKLPKNVVAWLNPSTNHLAEPPWVATAMLAVSLVAGTKFYLDSYKQEHVSSED